MPRTQPSSSTASLPNQRTSFSHYLPRLKREFYQGDAVVFWTLTTEQRQSGWLSPEFHLRFRELMLHCAAREGLLCPAYCLMPDHLHLVWMGLRATTDQRNGMAFLRTHLKVLIQPAALQHQAHDHVLTEAERTKSKFSMACTDYVLLNPWRAHLVTDPHAWPYLGAMVPGYTTVDPFKPGYWEWFWARHSEQIEPNLHRRTLPPREME